MEQETNETTQIIRQLLTNRNIQLRDYSIRQLIQVQLGLIRNDNLDDFPQRQKSTLLRDIKHYLILYSTQKCQILQMNSQNDKQEVEKRFKIIEDHLKSQKGSNKYKLLMLIFSLVAYALTIPKDFIQNELIKGSLSIVSIVFMILFYLSNITEIFRAPKFKKFK